MSLESHCLAVSAKFNHDSQVDALHLALPLALPLALLTALLSLLAPQVKEKRSPKLPQQFQFVPADFLKKLEKN